jgi:hypothetical protein
LIPRRIERYVIEDGPGGVALKMRQAPNALGFAAVTGSVLAVSWWFGPYGPHPTRFEGWFYWVWSGALGLFTILGIVAAWYREDWIITSRDTTVTQSFPGWRRMRRLPRTRALGIRVEYTRGSGREGGVFPWCLHILNEETQDASGLSVLLHRRRGVDRFFDALREVVTLDVDDPTER